MPSIYVRESRFRVEVEHLDEVHRIIREEFVGFFHTIPSYRGGVAYSDRQRGCIVTLSLWDGLTDQSRVGPVDLVAFVRNAAEIELELVSVELFDLVVEDRFAVDGSPARNSF